MECNGYQLMLIGFLVFGVMILIYYNNSASGQLNTTLALQIATLSIFMVQLLFTMKNYQISSIDRQKTYYSKYTQLTGKRLEMIDKMFMNNRLLDKLYAEMYSGNPEIDEICALSLYQPSTETKISRLKAEHHASLIVFQIMADVFMIGLTDRDGKFDDCEDLIEWKQTFQKWMRSPILRKQWKSLSSEYHPKFQYFMNNNLIVE